MKKRVIIVVAVALVVALGALAGAYYFAAKDLSADASAISENFEAIEDALTSGDFETAAQLSKEADAQAKALDETLASPLWSVAGAVPVLGGDVANARELTSILTTVSGEALVPVTSAIKTFNEKEGLEKITEISTLTEEFVAASDVIEDCTDRINDIPEMKIAQLQPVLDSAKEKLNSVNTILKNAKAQLGSLTLGGLI